MQFKSESASNLLSLSIILCILVSLDSWWSVTFSPIICDFGKKLNV